MASAEVGDDVLERDPTMAILEARVADLLGLEAAMWVPSGCMGNLIGLLLHLRRGDRFLAPAQAHVLGSELGTGAWLAVLAVGVLCTGVAYILYFRLIESVGPARSLAVTFIVPVFAMGYGVTLLHETVSAWMLLSAFVIVCGTSLSTGLVRLHR